MAGGAFKVVISGDYKMVLQVFRRLQSQNKQAVRKGLEVLSLNAKNFLVANYKGRVGLRPLSRGTLLKRRKGKPGSGARAPIPAYGGSRPLFRSGAMIRAIHRRPTGRLTYKIGIRPGFGQWSGGKTMDLAAIAAKQEHGYINTVAMTKRMWVYLMLLYGTITEPWQARLRRFRPKTLVINVPPRPVWGPTWDNDITPRSVQWMLEAWTTALGLQGRFK